MSEYTFERDTFDPDGPIEIPDDAIVLNGSRTWDSTNEEYRHVWVEYLRPV